MMNNMIKKQSGYLMVSVILTLVLVTTIAIMSSNEGAFNGRLLQGQATQRQGQYLLEAGMNHALWQSQRNECQGSFSIANTVLGNNAYTVASTSTGSSILYSLGVDQDSWINSDVPTQNRGSQNKLSISQLGGITQQALYRFDISTLPVGARIQSAFASFVLDDLEAHPEGAIQVHKINTDWAEGTVTWDSIDGRYDPQPIAQILPQASGDVVVRINLTAQVQAWTNGEANYGLALLASEGIDAKYYSREGLAGKQPKLEVVVGTTSAMDMSVIGTLANGATMNLERKQVPDSQGISASYIPFSSAVGEDTYIDSFYAARNWGAMAYLQVSSDPDWTTRSLIKFDLASLPAGAHVQSATLALKLKSVATLGGISVHRPQQVWTEGTKYGTGQADGASWQTYNGTNNWNSLGGDFDGPELSITEIKSGDTWVEFDIATLVREWLVGADNNGLMLVAKSPLDWAEFHSRDAASEADAPKVTINYSCPCGNACLAPRGTGNILMVVGDDYFVSAHDKYKQRLFQRWGYNVELIDDGALSLSFNAAFANNDVVFISESVNSLLLLNKVANSPIGIVSEEGLQNDELGFTTAGSNNWPVDNTLMVVDNSHYISQLFPLGDLQTSAAKMGGLAIENTPSVDLQVLANWGSDGALVVLDAGSAKAGGGTTSSRRVMLPFGRENYIDWRQVNNNGQLIVQRALAWASGSQSNSDKKGLWFTTRKDVASSGNSDLASWSSGQILSLSAPGLTLEPDTTGGKLSALVNLDDFAHDTNARIDALHYVTSNITLGGDHSVTLQPGDVLLSVADDEILTSINSLQVRAEDVFVYRPESLEDYSAGNFIFLLDMSMVISEEVVALSLVERDTLVGNGGLNVGDILLGMSNRRDVIRFIPTDVGFGSTAGSASEFIDGLTLNFDSEIRGLELAESDISLGGQAIPAGSILISLNHDDINGVADNHLVVDSADIFYLNVTQVGHTPIADAQLIFEGLDLSLDSDEEHLQALTLVTSQSMAPAGPIAHWPLDADTAAIAFDIAGNHDASVINDPAIVSGQIDEGLDFDGSSDYLQVPSFDVVGTGITMMAWFNAETISTQDGRFISKANGTSASDAFWQLSTTDVGSERYLRMRIKAGGTTTTLAAPSENLQPGQWYFAAATYSAITGHMWLYLNGEPVAHDPHGVGGALDNDDSVAIAIGANGSAERYFDGILDDVRLYDRALSPDEIQALYLEGAPPASYTFRDEFNISGSFSGSDGNSSWSSNWLEIGESDGAGAGDIQVGGPGIVRLQDNDNGGEGIQREADLSAFSHGTLSFDYYRTGLDSSFDYVTIDVSANGGLNWIELGRIEGPGSDASDSPIPLSFNIDDYLSNNTRIRFKTSSTMGNQDKVFLDNIQIEVSN